MFGLRTIRFASKLEIDRIDLPAFQTMMNWKR